MIDKFCIDCEFVVMHEITPPFCKHPANGINPVDGGIRETLAITARGNHKILFPDWDMCGVEGKHFKRKNVQQQITSKKWWEFMK